MGKNGTEFLFYANELFNLCNKMNIDYKKVSEIAQHDDRLGSSHFKVPGPDGVVPEMLKILMPF